MKKIRNIFISGLVVVLPIGITLWVLKMIFDKMDALLSSQIKYFTKETIPGLGVLAVILIVFIIGLIANNFIGNKITYLVDKILTKLPIIKTIYNPLRDIITNVSNTESNNFKKAVFVDFPKEGSQSIGFITKEHIMVNGEERTSIFVPTTPNPTSGFLLYLTRDDYKELDLPVDVALKSIISLGSISPDEILASNAPTIEEINLAKELNEKEEEKKLTPDDSKSSYFDIEKIKIDILEARKNVKEKKLDLKKEHKAYKLSKLKQRVKDKKEKKNR